MDAEQAGRGEIQRGAIQRAAVALDHADRGVEVVLRAGGDELVDFRAGHGDSAADVAGEILAAFRRAPTDGAAEVETLRIAADERLRKHRDLRALGGGFADQCDGADGRSRGVERNGRRLNCRDFQLSHLMSPYDAVVEMICASFQSGRSRSNRSRVRV